MPSRTLTLALLTVVFSCDGGDKVKPTDPWASATPGASQGDPWSAGPASAPGGTPAPPEPLVPAAASGPLVGEWFQGSAGAEVLDISGGWRTASGSAETWWFGPDHRYRHQIFRLSRLGSCTRRFLTTREGRYAIEDDTVTLIDGAGRVHAVSECSEGYDQAASPDPSPLRYRVDGRLLTLVGANGAVIADRFARRR